MRQSASRDGYQQQGLTPPLSALMHYESLLTAFSYLLIRNRPSRELWEKLDS